MTAIEEVAEALKTGNLLPYERLRFEIVARVKSGESPGVVAGAMGIKTRSAMQMLERFDREGAKALRFAGETEIERLAALRGETLRRAVPEYDDEAREALEERMRSAGLAGSLKWFRTWLKENDRKVGCFTSSAWFAKTRVDVFGERGQGPRKTGNGAKGRAGRPIWTPAIVVKSVPIGPENAMKVADIVKRLQEQHATSRATAHRLVAGMLKLKLAEKLPDGRIHRKAEAPAVSEVLEIVEL